MRKLFTTLVLALTLLMSSCYVEEYVTHDPSGPPYVTAPAPYPYYWTYPRYGTPYYSPNFYRPVPPPPRPRPRPTPPPNNRPPRPEVTPRPSTPNPPGPTPNRPNPRPNPGNNPRPNPGHTHTTGHR